ncbi:D-3-phosphoglycerate dehydrogenase [Arboricoccus pini]|uniref:D-3-phosphoglycerate dehydrogenase n=1 Tax=Arboricoccus pini TaxID=1963835 RepID=A0A212RXV4_9PROT|nr:NAD(P)-dependent oxidoreductase [Arboricoccus pini]SNB77463.1 D-3-phosphoglycerate dehydrogenase [Arboricoccus pini]
MKGLFIDASPALAATLDAQPRPAGIEVDLNLAAQVEPETLPGLLAGYDFALNDHSFMPTEVMRHCQGLRHVIFLGTGARSYMNPEALAELGITVHIIKGYGDRAVAEHAFALMFAAARGLAAMDRAMRAGTWRRTEGPELAGKTVGLMGYGGIGREMAMLCRAIGMRVLVWSRTPRPEPGITFVELDTLLEQSQFLSLHLLLDDSTRGILSAERLARLPEGAILVNTARGDLVDEAAMIEALKSGRLGHAALDVFALEPLPAGHPLTGLDNVTLSAHSAFRTPEASANLMRQALEIAGRLG